MDYQEYTLCCLEIRDVSLSNIEFSFYDNTFLGANFNSNISSILNISAYFFKDLINCGVLKKSKARSVHRSIQDAFHELAKGNLDSRAIFVFPYYRIFELVSDCTYFKSLGDNYSNKESVLFVRSEISHDKEFMLQLNLAIRDAWVELNSNKLLRDSLATMVLLNGDYLSTLYRFSGAHLIKPPSKSFSSTSVEMV